MNNDGGGIFSYLPQSTEGTYFEDLFGTPTGLEFSSYCSYVSMRNMMQFIQRKI